MSNLIDSIREYVLGTRAITSSQRKIKKAIGSFKGNSRTKATNAIAETILDIENEAEKQRRRGNFRDAANLYSEAASLGRNMGLSRRAYSKYQSLAEEMESLNKRKKNNRLEGEYISDYQIGIVGIGLSLLGLFIFSANITGNVIADIPLKNSSLLGAGLLLAGLIAGFFWFRRKKR